MHTFRRALSFAGLLFAACLMASTAKAAFAVPPLTGAVVDQPGLMDAAARQQLDSALQRLWASGGSQVAVLIVDNLDQLPIEQASIKVTDAWKLGQAKGDNGVLLLIATAERGLRIEVGQGLEGQLPDAYAKRIIDDVMVPYFKAGDQTAGIVAGVRAILSYTDPSAQVDVGAVSSAVPKGRSGGLPRWLFLLILVLAWTLQRSTRRGRMGNGTAALLGGLLGALGGGRGGGGGGGFSGGGGGFSGGGASGKW